MTHIGFDVLTVGNAIVDTVACVEDDFLIAENIKKSAMNIIDANRAEHLYSVIKPLLQTSGGSASNTAAGLASLGSRSAYFGKISNDPLGDIFTHDMQVMGISFGVTPLRGNPLTAQSIILITPDGERTMNTYLGACMEFSPEDIEVDVVSASQITYFEGYLWDSPHAKEAIRLAIAIAHDHNHQVAITLSDSFCVDRHRDDFLQLMTTGTVDIVFANEAEIKSLYQKDDIATIISAVRQDVALSALTLGERGSIVVTRENIVEVPAYPIETFVDATGAGDLYASGFLYGLTNNLEMYDCARIGGLAAAEVIQHIGPRPKVSLKERLQQSELYKIFSI
ncbi:adenosine kinase [Candidatus Endowatersipora endosymbiont of Watersipora subatra]|uniref:adenosine kinase n=1 Tax=Candidatus Endowatersipora endosymbiont of Watersipora subatra TaxID=3077946 RepID=UPI003C7B0D6A